MLLMNNDIEMKYRSMGRTGVHVSQLCLGCMMFGAKTSPEDSEAIIKRAIDAGINMLDTANAYERGRGEEVVGDALKKNGLRDDVILATKVHFGMGADPNMKGNSRRHIIQQCESSLKRLKTDWIDLYQIHRPQPSVPIDETLRALDDLIRQGKVRYIGTSTFGAWQYVDALWAAKELGLNRFVTEQPPYNLLERRVERELLNMARHYGVAVFPWSPLAGGLLTGKYRKNNPSPAEGRYANLPEGNWMGQRLNENMYAAIEDLIALAEKKETTLSRLALAWVMAQPGVTAPIIGPRTMEQFEDNLAATHISLTQEDLQAIDAICPPGGMFSPFYNSNWGPGEYR